MNHASTHLARQALACAIAVSCMALAPGAVAQSSSRPAPVPASDEKPLQLPELESSPQSVANTASAPLRRRLLAPRTGSAVTSGISGQSGGSGYSGGNANGINNGLDASRSSNGAGGSIAAPMGSKPLQPREIRPVRRGASGV